MQTRRPFVAHTRDYLGVTEYFSFLHSSAYSVRQSVRTEKASKHKAFLWIALCFFLGFTFSLLFHFFIFIIIFLRYYSFFDSLRPAENPAGLFAFIKIHFGQYEFLIFYPEKDITVCRIRPDLGRDKLFHGVYCNSQLLHYGKNAVSVCLCLLL